jgi:hypothetical protein
VVLSDNNGASHAIEPGCRFLPNWLVSIPWDNGSRLINLVWLSCGMRAPSFKDGATARSTVFDLVEVDSLVRGNLKCQRDRMDQRSMRLWPISRINTAPSAPAAVTHCPPNQVSGADSESIERLKRRALLLGCNSAMQKVSAFFSKWARGL